MEVLGVEDSQKIESVKCIGLKNVNARRERNITLKDIRCGCVAEQDETDVTAEVPLIMKMQPIKKGIGRVHERTSYPNVFLIYLIIK